MSDAAARQGMLDLCSVDIMPDDLKSTASGVSTGFLAGMGDFRYTYVMAERSIPTVSNSTACVTLTDGPRSLDGVSI